MRNGNRLLPIPVDGELKDLIEQAARRTRLTQADVMRSALRIGVPELVKRLEGPKGPRPETLLGFAGLVINRNRELVKPSRFE